MSRVSYQAMLEPSDEDGARFDELRPADLPSRRRDATERLRVRVSERHTRWLDEVTAQTGLTRDLVVMAALDLMIALDVDWDGVERPRDLRDALTQAAGVRPRRDREP